MRGRMEYPAPGASAPAVPRPALMEIGLPQRACNALRLAGLSTLDEVAEWSLRDLRSLPQMGPASIAVLEDALHARGLDLRQSLRRRRL